MYRQKSIRKFFIYIFPIACGALGYLILLLSPSGSAKFSENLSLSLLFKNAIAIFTEYYNACRIPLILFFVLLGIAIYQCHIFRHAYDCKLSARAKPCQWNCVSSDWNCPIAAIIARTCTLRMYLPVCVHLSSGQQSDDVLGRFLRYLPGA